MGSDTEYGLCGMCEAIYTTLWRGVCRECYQRVAAPEFPPDRKAKNKKEGNR